jgi:hypothetical protein
MLNKEVTEMNYMRKISRETSPPADPGLYDLHFGICGHAVNLLAGYANDKKNHFETIPKMG